MSGKKNPNSSRTLRLAEFFLRNKHICCDESKMKFNMCSPANILGETWSSSSDAKKLNFLLYGVKSANYDINCALFREVQTFIINTNRFSMATV